MGLDVYLYHCADRAKARAEEKAVNDYTDSLWEAVGGYRDATKEQEAEINAKAETFAKERGCASKWGDHESVTKIKNPSTIAPDHYFKVGYFRSSYNDGGINNVMRNRGLSDLYDIFNPNEEYEFTPDWRGALQKTEEAIKAYGEHLGSTVGDVSVIEIGHNLMVNPDKYPKSEVEAMAIVKAEREKERHADIKAYGTALGEFFPEPLPIVALINGFHDAWMGQQQPCIYAVYQKPEQNGEDWYLTALRIVKETCEFVLVQPDPQNYYLHWSS